MRLPLAVLLAAALAAPVFAQTDSTKIGDTGKRIEAARIGKLGAPPAETAKARLVRPILSNAVVNELLKGDYEQNERAERGLAPEVLKTFVVLSAKPDVLKAFKERHYMSAPSGKLFTLPVAAGALAEETQRKPDEVRSIGSRHIGITYFDGSIRYLNLSSADEASQTIYLPAGEVSKDGVISGMTIKDLLHDALRAMAFSEFDRLTIPNSIVTVLMERHSPEKYVISGSKADGLFVTSGGHKDKFWPTVELAK